MKKRTYLSMVWAILFCLTKLTLYAGPIDGDTVNYTQPDGSNITIILYGDEKLHWASTLDGYTVLSTRKGYYVYAFLDEKGNLNPSDIIVHNINLRNREEMKFLSKTRKNLFFNKLQTSANIGLKKNSIGLKGSILGSLPKTGSIKMACILVSFQDVK